MGKIPANRLYTTGLNLLNIYPLPNLPNTPGVPYNFELTRPTERALGSQPAIRVDYQPSSDLRATVKYSGFRQRNQVFNGRLPGFNDSKQYRPLVYTFATTVNYTVNPTTFVEATYGMSQNELAGCIYGGNVAFDGSTVGPGSTGPVFCQTGIAQNAISNRNTAGLGGLPMLFPDALKVDHELLRV